MGKVQKNLLRAQYQGCSLTEALRCASLDAGGARRALPTTGWPYKASSAARPAHKNTVYQTMRHGRCTASCAHGSSGQRTDVACRVARASSWAMRWASKAAISATPALPPNCAASRVWPWQCHVSGCCPLRHHTVTMGNSRPSPARQAAGWPTSTGPMRVPIAARHGQAANDRHHAAHAASRDRGAAHAKACR